MREKTRKMNWKYKIILILFSGLVFISTLYLISFVMGQKLNNTQYAI